MSARPNPRKHNGHRRREVRAQVLAEEDMCALCHHPVDKALSLGPDGRPHPLRAEVDEKIPVSRGGSPTVRANCQLVHRCCNQAKSNRITPADYAHAYLAAATAGGPGTEALPLSRAW